MCQSLVCIDFYRTESVQKSSSAFLRSFETRGLQPLSFKALSKEAQFSTEIQLVFSPEATVLQQYLSIKAQILISIYQ